MTGKKEMITSEDLASIWSRYLISNFFEFLIPLEGETLRSHREGCVCLNEWMFKVGVRIPLEFGISELLNIFGVAPIQIMPNSWRIIQSVQNVGLEELEHGQRAALEFLQSNNLKWHSTRGAFLQWCDDLPLSGGLGAPLRSESAGSLGPSSGTQSSFGVSRVSASRRAGDRARLVERPKKRKRLIDAKRRAHDEMHPGSTEYGAPPSPWKAAAMAAAGELHRQGSDPPEITPSQPLFYPESPSSSTSLPATPR
ncbi:hypothetical protein ACLOJK_034942 [Asimina triloba]